MTKVVVMISIDPDVLAEIDRRAIAANMTRSEYMISMALKACQTTEVEPSSGSSP